MPGKTFQVRDTEKSHTVYDQNFSILTTLNLGPINMSKQNQSSFKSSSKIASFRGILHKCHN